eukprot:Lankesteria_metandrocarpae@DN6553_c0_g1_i1.p1
MGNATTGTNDVEGDTSSAATADEMDSSTAYTIEGVHCTSSSIVTTAMPTPSTHQLTSLTADGSAYERQLLLQPQERSEDTTHAMPTNFLSYASSHNGFTDDTKDLPTADTGNVAVRTRHTSNDGSTHHNLRTAPHSEYTDATDTSTSLFLSVGVTDSNGLFMPPS